jgi:hypothetical protein
MIVTPVEEEEISIGGVMLRFHNKDLMSL